MSLYWEKEENNQKEAEIGPFFKKNIYFQFFSFSNLEIALTQDKSLHMYSTLHEGLYVYKQTLNISRGPFHKPKRIRKLQIVYHCTDDLQFDLFGLGIINSLALVD